MSEAAGESSRAASLSAAQTASGGLGPGVELSSDDGEGAVPTAKLYRYSAEIEYCDTLLVKAMVAVFERDRSNMGFVLSSLVKEYHEQMRDEKSNPRPPKWPAKEYLKHSAFKTDEEWNAYFDSSKNSGLSSDARPDSGMPPPIQQWAQLKFNKWNVIKREIFNHTHAEWVRLFPGGNMPSGKKMWQMIESLRFILFKIWMMAPTRKGGHCNYKAQPMPANFIPFSSWHLWVRIGPGGSEKSLVFVSECCTPILPFHPANGASTADVPDEITQLYVNTDTKANFVARKADRVVSSQKRASSSAAPPLSNSQKDLLASSASAKLKRKMDNETIQRLRYLIDSPHATAVDKQKYGLKLFVFLKKAESCELGDTSSGEDAESRTVSVVSQTKDTSEHSEPPFMSPSPITVGSGSALSMPSFRSTPVQPGVLSSSMISDLTASATNLCRRYDVALCTDDSTDPIALVRKKAGFDFDSSSPSVDIGDIDAALRGSANPDLALFSAQRAYAAKLAEHFTFVSMPRNGTSLMECFVYLALFYLNQQHTASTMSSVLQQWLLQEETDVSGFGDHSDNFILAFVGYFRIEIVVFSVWNTRGKIFPSLAQDGRLHVGALCFMESHVSGTPHHYEALHFCGVKTATAASAATPKPATIPPHPAQAASFDSPSLHLCSIDARAKAGFQNSFVCNFQVPQVPSKDGTKALSHAAYEEFIQIHFDITPIDPNGNCLFECFAFHLKKWLGIDNTQEAIRRVVGDHIAMKQATFEKNIFDVYNKDLDQMEVQAYAGAPKRTVTLAQYVAAVKDTMYGGDLEMFAFADKYCVDVIVFSAVQKEGALYECPDPFRDRCVRSNIFCI